VAYDYIERDRENERIDRMYEDVEAAVVALLVTAYASGSAAKVTAATATAKQMIDEARAQTRVWDGEAVPRLYGEVNPLTATTMPRIMEASANRFDAMTTTVTRRLDELASSFFDKEARIEALRRYSTARIGTRIGVKGMATEIEAGLRERGITGFVDSIGREWRLSTYAKMAARTTTMEAQTAGVKDRVLVRGDDLVNIVGPMDYPDGCPPAVLGGPYSITGATTEYEGRAIMSLDRAIDYYVVFHPRCRHSLSAVV
jgi:hypothetical protein